MRVHFSNTCVVRILNAHTGLTFDRDTTVSSVKDLSTWLVIILYLGSSPFASLIELRLNIIVHAFYSVKLRITLMHFSDYKYIHSLDDSMLKKHKYIYIF